MPSMCNCKQSWAAHQYMAAWDVMAAAKVRKISSMM